MMLPLLLFVLVLGAGGFAYWQFGMQPDQSAPPRRHADASTEVQETQTTLAAATPMVATPMDVPVPPVPVMPEAQSLPTATPPNGLSATESIVAQGSLMAGVPDNGGNSSVKLPTHVAVVPAPASSETVTAPAILPAPPLPDHVSAATHIEAPALGQTAVFPVGSDVASTSDIPSIALSQKPPVVDIPLPPAIDHSVVAANRVEKAALDKEVVDLKQAVVALNDKIKQLKAVAASQDAALKQAQVALKDANAKAAVAAEQAEKAATKVKTELAVVKPVKATKKIADAEKPKKILVEKKTAPTMTAHSKKTVVKHAAVKATAKANTWVLRSVAAGGAWIASSASSNDLKEIHVGDSVPGLGKIKAISSKDGHWVVEGSVRSLK